MMSARVDHLVFGEGSTVMTVEHSKGGPFTFEFEDVWKEGWPVLVEYEDATTLARWILGKVAENDNS